MRFASAAQRTAAAEERGARRGLFGVRAEAHDAAFAELPRAIAVVPFITPAGAPFSGISVSNVASDSKSGMSSFFGRDRVAGRFVMDLR